jgi:hypothetical protein
MPPTDTTTAQRLVSSALGEPVHDWIIAKRAMGMSWRSVANHLEDETGVYITHETIRQWSQEVAV